MLSIFKVNDTDRVGVEDGVGRGQRKPVPVNSAGNREELVCFLSAAGSNLLRAEMERGHLVPYSQGPQRAEQGQCNRLE